MTDSNAAAHADTIEYYRLALEARRLDPYAREAVKVDAETLEMVRKTPDVLEMNRAFMEGGLAFRLTRALAVDGARFAASTHTKLGQDELAEHWEERAKVLARAEDYAAIDAVAEQWSQTEAELREKIERTKQLVDEGLECLLKIGAAKAGSKLSEGDLTKLRAGLEELRRRHPDMRFPELLRLPYVRDRLPWSVDKLPLFDDLFERVNRDELKGGF